MPRIGGAAVEPAPALRALPEHVSFSQLSRLVGAYRHACARQWGYRYLLRLPETTGIGLICGRALDGGLNHYFAERPEKPITSADAALAAFDAELAGTDELSKPLTEEEIDRYRLMVAHATYEVIQHEQQRTAAAVQTRHDFTVGAITPGDVIEVTGWSDRIDDDGTIVDHKWTGTRPVTEKGEWDRQWLAEKRDQLAVYWLARRAEERRGVPQPAPVVPRGRIVVAYHRINMKSPQVFDESFEFDSGDEQRVVAIVREGWAIMREMRLPARPGEHCRMCSFLGRCRTDEEQRGMRFAELVGAA